MIEKTKALAKPYEPTTRERTALDAQYDRRRRRSPAPSMKLSTRNNGSAISLDHADEAAVGVSLLMEAIGTADPDFFRGLIKQFVDVADQNEQELNFMLSVVKGIMPRDEVEAMLAAQMAATHKATMTLACRLNHAENIPQLDSAERAFNKLARTFTAQVEALKRYRSSGEQTVRVEHVTVNEGGQAIVGNVTHGGRGPSVNTEPSS
jgi:hypothetical protein